MSPDITFTNPDEIFPSDLKERYYAARLIGKGGMGRVFKAHDSRLNRDVAIKLLPASTDKTSAVLRFQQEAKAVSKLNNPHIVRVQDFGFTEGELEPFLVMEFIEGTNLDAVVEKNGKLPFRRAIEIAIEVCEGLAHAHNNGILHRDLKPGNIMLDANNRVRILDFGLAKILKQSQDDTEQALTQPGRLMGSVLFMSPEQFEGKEANEVSEIYSLGLVLYNIVTGDIPYQGENLMAFMRKRREGAPPVLPDDLTDPLRTELNPVLQKALATDPAERFGSILELQDALINCLKSGVNEDELPSPTVSPQKFSTNSLAIGGIVLITAAIGLAFYQTTKTPSQSPPRRSDKPAGRLADGGLPPGFSTLEDEGVTWWIGPDVKDDALETLIGSDVQNLSLQGNTSISDEGLHRIRMLKLVALDVRDTQISDKSAVDIDNFKLKALNIRSTKITDEGILRMTPNPNLTALDLKYLAITDRGLAHIVRNFPNLESINVGFTQVNRNGQHLRVLKKLPHLKRFFAEQIELTDSDIDTLVSMKVVSCELAANPITRRSVDKLLRLPRLDFLSLAGCKGISEADMAKLKEKFPKATIVEPVHKQDAVNDEAIEMFMKTDPH